jgi:hypothetical protein
MLIMKHTFQNQNLFAAWMNMWVEDGVGSPLHKRCAHAIEFM